jgi:hypothetical protein
LIESTLREDRSIADLLNTNYTFVNQRLAEHYGMKGIYGSEFRRVAVNDPNRQGLLGQASILTVTSYPNRTAPTIRGKWVLEQLLGTPPAAAATQRPVPEGGCKHKEPDHASTHGTAQIQSHLRRLPPHDGPARLRAGKL